MAAKNIDQEVGQRVEQSVKDMQLRQIAEESGISLDGLKSVMRGEAHLSRGQLCSLATALHVEMHTLLPEGTSVEAYQ